MVLPTTQDTIQDIIQRISIDPQSSIRQAMHAIDRGAMGLALLADGQSQRFLGLVTDGDIRRALLGGSGLESPVAGVARPQATNRAGRHKFRAVGGSLF